MNYRFEDEPEDVWSPGDPVSDLIDNLCWRCALLGEPCSVVDDDAERAGELAHLLHRLIIRRHQLDDAGRVRVDGIARHLAIIQQRIIGYG